MESETIKAHVRKAFPSALSLKRRIVDHVRPLVNVLLEPKALRGVPNKPLVRALLKQRIWPDGSRYDSAAQQLYVKDWDASVAHGAEGWSVERDGLTLRLDSEQAFLWATDLFGKGQLPATTRDQQRGRPRWRGETQGFHFFMESVCDMNTAKELFIEQEYRWFNEQLTPGCVVWDIGMNLGMASLLFASNENVKRVYSFEPIADTFSVASEAIAGNPMLLGKITASNAGIAGCERDEQFDYTPRSKAGTGMVGILPTTLRHYDIQPDDIQKVDAHLLDASRVLRQIRAENPDAPIYVKCDCEGAEYEIIDRLTASGALSEIEALVVECHKNEPGKIVSRLAAAGFAVELQTKVEGLFYHVKASRNAGCLKLAADAPGTLIDAAERFRQSPLPKAA